MFGWRGGAARFCGREMARRNSLQNVWRLNWSPSATAARASAALKFERDENYFLRIGAEDQDHARTFASALPLLSLLIVSICTYLLIFSSTIPYEYL